MLTVTCPFCQEKGRIPENFMGKRIKCGKCSNKFLVTPPASKGEGVKAEKVETLAPAAAAPAHEGIEVHGLEADAWTSGAASAV